MSSPTPLLPTPRSSLPVAQPRAHAPLLDHDTGSRLTISMPWQHWDVRLFLSITTGSMHGALRLRCAQVIARWSWVPMLGVLLIQVGIEPALWGWVSMSLLLAGLVQWMVKRITRRWPVARPFALGLCPNHLNHGPRGGFPSAHALVMGFLIGMLGCCAGVAPGLWGLLCALALITAWARVHAGAHFVSDVVVGLLMGAAIGAGLAALWLWGFHHPS